MFWLALLIIGALAGATLSQPKRAAKLLGGRKQKQLPAPSRDLAGYADENGWRLFPGDAKQIQAEALKLFNLAGPPSLEVLYALKAMDPIQLAKEPEAYLREPWQLVALLRRDTADGPQTVLGARAYGGTKAVIACMATRSTVDHFGLDVVGWDSKVYSSGEAPTDVKFDKVLSGLRAPLRLRFTEGTLLLRIPGELDAASAADIVGRLDDVRTTLPRRPDLGPLR